MYGGLQSISSTEQRNLGRMNQCKCFYWENELESMVLSVIRTKKRKIKTHAAESGRTNSEENCQRKRNMKGEKKPMMERVPNLKGPLRLMIPDYTKQKQNNHQKSAADQEGKRIRQKADQKTNRTEKACRLCLGSNETGFLRTRPFE
jgi:hypothetical protein